MRRTGAILRRRAKDLNAYEPAKPEVGVLFSPQSYYLNWASEANANRTGNAFAGYCRGLVRNSIPWLAVEERHLAGLDGLKVLFAPRTVAMDDCMESGLFDWVRRGGCLVCESEFGAFDSRGLYRYPAERALARRTGLVEIGRRRPQGAFMGLDVNGEVESLDITQWLTPMSVPATRGARVLRGDVRRALVAEVPFGRGRVLAVGAYLGDAYMKQRGRGFERFVNLIVERAGVTRDIRVVDPAPDTGAFLYVKHGTSRGRRVVFVFFPPACKRIVLEARRGFFRCRRLTEWISGGLVELRKGRNGIDVLTVDRPDDGVAVLEEESGNRTERAGM
jgi:beta-galactosidase